MLVPADITWYWQTGRRSILGYPTRSAERCSLTNNVDISRFQTKPVSRRLAAAIGSLLFPLLLLGGLFFLARAQGRPGSRRAVRDELRKKQGPVQIGAPEPSSPF